MVKHSSPSLSVIRLVVFLVTSLLIWSQQQCDGASTGLMCYSCNSGIKGQESCKDGTSADNMKKFLVNCADVPDYTASQWFAHFANSSSEKSNLSAYPDLKENGYVGVKYWGIKKPDVTALEASYKTQEEGRRGSQGIDEINPTSTSLFVCRKIVISIPYDKSKSATKTAVKDRVIRLCGVRFKKGYKMDCVSHMASAKTEIDVCTCDKNTDGKPCNGIMGNPKESLYVIIGAFLLFEIFSNVIINGKLTLLQ